MKQEYKYAIIIKFKNPDSVDLPKLNYWMINNGYDNIGNNLYLLKNMPNNSQISNVVQCITDVQKLNQNFEWFSKNNLAELKMLRITDIDDLLISLQQ